MGGGEAAHRRSQGMRIPGPLAILGPLPLGDPGAMRASAGKLRAEAQAVTGVVDTISARAGHLQYEGKAAHRFHDAVRTATTTGRAQAHALEELAQWLEREAAKLADTQATWKRRVGEIER